MTPTASVIKCRAAPTLVARHFRSLSTARVSPSDVVANEEPQTTPRSCPHLRKVPSLPLVGSMIPQHSGLPKFEMSKQYENNTKIREAFGDFLTLGVPGFGVGSHGTTFVIRDPDEMMKIVRNEGSQPSGIVEKIWSWRRLLRESGSAMVSRKEENVNDGSDGYDYGLLDRGEGWKRQRTFLQTGMLDPRAARGFIPGIVAAAEQASSAASAHSTNMNEFLNYAAFDMFGSFMFGEVMGTTSSVVSTDEDVKGANEENESFVAAALATMDSTGRLGMFPQEYIMSEKLGIKSSRYRKLEEVWMTVREIGLKKIHAFIDRYDRDELNDIERASYLAGAIERQRESGEVSQDEMIELCLFALFVGVDTTSSVTAWNLMHLAMNPEIQEKLHDELSSAVQARGSDGSVNAEVLGKSASPYLHMCVRESHRVTPAFGAAMWKSNCRSDVDVHGVTVPKGSLVQLGHLTFDSEFVDEPRIFRPERWTVDAAASREGTKSEVIDHPLLRDPFSQGARRCPGSRVATNEILAMTAQLVLDWKISAPTVDNLDDVKYDSSPIKPIFPTLHFEAR